MSVESGTNLHQYRLVEKIGEGGMGVVWRAVDTHLEREVAVKVLPESFADDPERLARFEREAKLLASLSHPNIAAVHGLDEADGVRFIAMELVAGEDLAKRLERGPLSVEETARIGLQIAQALEAAHENGVIHRDLKPANVQLTSDGDVKVLDFGLAKAFETEAASGDPSLSPTMTSAGTVAGVILGTAGYMSPEQVHGRAADRRADLWSLGCVMYEMLTGRSAFSGESISDTLASVLKLEADQDALPSGVPGAMRKLLRRCLTKDPRQRLQAAGEARIVLERILSGTPGGEEASAPVQAAPPGKLGMLARIGTILVVAAAALAAGWLLRPVPEPRLRKLPIGGPGSTNLGLSNPLAISPDGTRLAFISEGKLWIRRLDRLEAREVPNTENAMNPFWSSDSRFIGYGVHKAIWRVTAEGTDPKIIGEIPDSLTGGAAGAAWLPDGRVIYCTGSHGLYQISASGGDPVEVLATDPDTDVDFHNANPLPDDRGVLFMIHRKEGRNTIATWDGEQAIVIFRAEGYELERPVYSSSGHILYTRTTNNPGIWALPFSLAKLEVTGEPFLVVANATVPSVSDDGTLAFLRGTGELSTEFVWYDSRGEALDRFGRGPEIWPFPAVSPDGGRVVSAARAGTRWDLWVHDVTRKTKTRITFDNVEHDFPVWTPDGQKIIYGAGSDPTDYVLEITRADGSGGTRVLWDADECRPSYYGMNPSVSPDGRTLIYGAHHTGTEEDICTLALEPDAEPSVFLRTKAREMAPEISPDGRYVAYQSDESGRDEIYVTTFPEGEGKWQVSVDGGAWVRWSAAGDMLFYARRDELMAVDVDTEGSLRLGTPWVFYLRTSTGQGVGFGRPNSFDVAADGRILEVELARPDNAADADIGITLVENWASEF